MRPPSSTFIASTNPSPRLPTMFAAGTRQSEKTTEAVSDARIPSLFSFLSGPKPGMPFSKMNAVMPLLPFSRSVTATATQTSA